MGFLGLGLGSFGFVATATSQQQTLPPVHLHLSQPAPASTPTDAPSAGTYTQAPATPTPTQNTSDSGTYTQAGRYPQPQRETPTYTTPAPSGAMSTTSSPMPGTYVQAQPGQYTQAGRDTPAYAAPAAPTETATRHISLGYSPRPPQPAPAASAAPVTETSSRAPDVTRPIRSAPVMAADVSAHEKPKSKRRVAPKTPELIVLPPKPVLDEYGLQRMGPDGKPMFAEPVKQQRDKHGKPLFEDGKPVFQTAEELGFDERGRKIKPVKTVEPPKNLVVMQHGAFMVDGIVGKVQLNYDIGELHYLYLYVPDTGVTVVSDKPFPGATVQRGAFVGNALTVKIQEHVLKVSGDNQFFGKKPVNAYVMVDRGFVMPRTKYPVFGYGETTKAPYEWPGSKADEKRAGASDDAPPVPKNLRPKLLDDACQGGVACGASPAAVAPASPVSAPAAPAASAPADASVDPAATASVTPEQPVSTESR